LQVSGTVEEVIKNHENTLAFKNTLQATEEAEQQFELTPISHIGGGLCLLRSSREYFLGNIVGFVIGVKDDSGDERDLERLFRDELNNDVQ